ncbi:MAG: hypothetical protein MRK02_10945 [Candidatus Scalindua sp.]|nr:hypothetical protein [Candidatus Scalindua sp.]
MKKSINFALIVVFIIGVSIFSYHSGTVKGGKQVDRVQYETIEFDFKIFTVRGHEYLARDGLGIVHMADCKLCMK